MADCGDVTSLESMQIQYKHQIFEIECITGLAGGIAGGANIDYATNPVTGQVQKTLPAILRDTGFRPASFTFATGGTLVVGDSDVVVLWPISAGGDGQYYLWKGAYPKTFPAASSPAATGGVSDSGWLPWGDVTLRGDLASTGGADLVTTASGMTVQDIINSGVRVIDVAPNTGADVTSLLQSEFNTAGAMFIPEGVYMIKAHTEDGGFAGVRPKNDSLIIFHPKAVFKAITNNQPAYAIINFQSVSNITLIGPNVVGDNDTHVGVTGEFGMGLYIRDSHNINIQRPNISKCWGDGIYIGQVGSVGACTNVTIDEPVIDECRRQGISIISADGLTINNPVITNIAGTPPSAGIDIEPNTPSSILNNIKINNLKTKNTASGLVIDLALFTDGVATKSVDIVVNGHSDEGSGFGATFTRNLHPTEGSIRYFGVNLKDNENNGILQRRWHSQGAHIIVDHPVVINPNRAGNGSVLNAAGIAGYTLSSDASPTNGSGNITIINPRVVFEAGITPTFPAQISFRDTKSGNVDKVKILDMVDAPATFIETTADFNRSTCEVTTSSNTKYLGKETSVEQQNFGLMGKFSGSLVASGLTSRAVIVFPASSLWKPGIIRVAATCCATTSGTPAANSIGYSESLIGYRHKNSSVPVGINKIDTVANANAVISVAYFDSPLRAEVTVTMLAAGNTVGWDVEAGGPAGSPLSISIL